MKQRLIHKMMSQRCIIDCHTHVGISFKNYVTQAYPYCLSFEDLVVRMKSLGIGRSVVFPMDSSFYRASLIQEKEIRTTREFSKFPYELENRNLLKEIYEIFPEYSALAIPFLTFDPSRQTQKQADLLTELYKDYPVFGLKTCTTYIQAFIKDLDTVGKPILEFALKYNLPMIIHSSYDKYDPWAALDDIIRIAERHPALRVCIAHTARFVNSALEKAASLRNCFVDLSAFFIHCLLAVQNHRAIPPEGERFSADYSKPATVMKKIVEEFGDTIIWGSDTPSNYFIQKYYDATGEIIDTKLKSGFDSEIRLLRTLSDEYIQKIAYENTLKFLFG